MNHSLVFALFALAMPIAIQAQISGGSSGSDESPSNATLQRECDGGSLSSCGMLGQRYQDNDNASPADMKKGFALFKRACDGGDTISCGDLAQSYLFGQGVAVDELRAAQLGERICNDGNMVGCALLGIIHQEGQAGYPKNPTKALSYYRMACNERQPRWEFPCKRADALAGAATLPAASVESKRAATNAQNGPVISSASTRTTEEKSFLPSFQDGLFRRISPLTIQFADLRKREWRAFWDPQHLYAPSMANFYTRSRISEFLEEYIVLLQLAGLQVFEHNVVDCKNQKYQSLYRSYTFEYNKGQGLHIQFEPLKPEEQQWRFFSSENDSRKQLLLSRCQGSGDPWIPTVITQEY